MMKLMDLYTRVVETTGLDIITLDSLNTAVANCMADLTSRGYRTFCEKHLEDFYTTFKQENFKQIYNIEEVVHLIKPYDKNKKYYEGDIVEINSKVYKYVIEDIKKPLFEQNQNLIKLPLPDDVRKNVYIRLFFNNEAVLATRYSLSNKRVACKYEAGAFRSLIPAKQAIYYIKGDSIIIEWDPYLGDIQDICYGYYQRLIAPKVDSTIEDIEQLESIEFDIRAEFEDAIVLYAAYFYYSRYVKDTEKIQFYLAQYKYYVEDITHELAYEDDFNEEDAVIKCEED